MRPYKVLGLGQAKSEKRRAHAEIVANFLEPLAETLEKHEFEFLG